MERPGDSSRTNPASVQHPAILPVPMQDAMLALEAGRAPFEVKIELAPDLNRVVGMNAREPGLGNVRQLAGAGPEDLLPARRQEESPATHSCMSRLPWPSPPGESMKGATRRTPGLTSAIPATT